MKQAWVWENQVSDRGESESKALLCGGNAGGTAKSQGMWSSRSQSQGTRRQVSEPWRGIGRCSKDLAFYSE